VRGHLQHGRGQRGYGGGVRPTPLHHNPTPNPTQSLHPALNMKPAHPLRLGAGGRGRLHAAVILHPNPTLPRALTPPCSSHSAPVFQGSVGHLTYLQSRAQPLAAHERRRRARGGAVLADEEWSRQTAGGVGT
jgi:hypothetical protein